MKIYRNGCAGLGADEEFDWVVIGAGGAGLAAALFGALRGATVLIVESTEWVGGTTALSAGTSWIPLSHHSAAVNPNDSLEAAKRYLDAAVGERSPCALRNAFLTQGRAAVRELEEKTEVKYRPYAKHPDYISDLDGSTLNGRAIEPLPFDGRLLGKDFDLLRPPIPEFTVLGGMMVDRTDINHLLAMTKSWASLKHSMRLLSRHALDRLRYSRGTRLVMGNAYIARLLYSLLKQERVSLVLRAKVTRFIQNDQGISGLELGDAKVFDTERNQARNIRVRQGVVLASGGFNRHPQMREAMLPGVPEQWCPAAPGHQGQMHDLARELGAAHGAVGKSHAFWAPVSMRQRADGSTAVFPHFVMDRAKPGMMTVNSKGERFVNESTSYHLFGLAMQAAHVKTPSIPAFLICDSVAIKKYGLGMIRPGANQKNLDAFLADGYLSRGESLQELASKLNIDPEGLQASIEQMNECAANGVDPYLHRGETAYQQNLGDASAGWKNPNLGSISVAPFYAIKLYPGDIGASTGLATDEYARVLNAAGQPLPKLYAVGNDMQSIMGGVYPAPGITLGPGLVFAFIASNHALAR